MSAPQLSQRERASILGRLLPKQLLRHVALAAVAGSLVAGIVYAVTTISANVTTDGTLAVTGRATTSASLVVGTTQPGPWNLGAGDLFIGNEATTTGNVGIGAGSGSDDDSLYFDSVSSEYLSWLDTRGEFSLSDDLTISGNATSTGYFVIGATQPTNNMAAGDILIGNNATSAVRLVIGTTQPTGVVGAGSLYVGAGATTTNDLAVGQGSGTNDDSLYFDINSAEFLSWLDTRDEFTLSDDFRIQGNGTSTGYLVVGTNNPTRNLSAGDAWIGGIASSTNLVVSLRATTSNALIVGTSQPGPFNLGEGDLFVGAEATTTGNLGVGQSSGSDDDSLYFDQNSSESLTWLDTRSTFELSDDLNIVGNATSTGYLVVGANNPTTNLAAGSLWVGGTASSTNLVVSGSATTTGPRFSIGHSTQTANSTTTVTFGSYEATGSNQGVCLKIRQGTAFVWCYISGTTLSCSTTVNCE